MDKRGARLKAKKLLNIMLILLIGSVFFVSVTGCAEDEYNDDCKRYAQRCPNQSLIPFEYDLCQIEEDHYYTNIYYVTDTTENTWATDETEYYCSGDSCRGAAIQVIVLACPNVTEEDIEEGIINITK